MQHTYESTVAWLLESDEPALRYQVERDLLDSPQERLTTLRDDIPRRGWGKFLLDQQKEDGGWGRDAYGPKWTCTHYVAYELLQLGFPPGHPRLNVAVSGLLSHPRGADGGVNYAKTVAYSDVCINGTLLAVAAYFEIQHEALPRIVEFVLDCQLSNGAWNSEFRNGETQGSLHTTFAVVEGLWRYLQSYYDSTAQQALQRGLSFMLDEKLITPHSTKERLRDELYTFSFPARYKFDVLRGLDLLREIGYPYELRMKPAIEAILAKSTANGRWRPAVQSGQTYGRIEGDAIESRWNTLRALRVLKQYGLP